MIISSIKDLRSIGGFNRGSFSDKIFQTYLTVSPTKYFKPTLQFLQQNISSLPYSFSDKIFQTYHNGFSVNNLSNSVKTNCMEISDKKCFRGVEHVKLSPCHPWTRISYLWKLPFTTTIFSIPEECQKCHQNQNIQDQIKYAQKVFNDIALKLYIYNLLSAQKSSF